GNTYVTHQDYEVGSQPAPMMLDDGGNYTVVAYSYNSSNALPAPLTSETTELTGARADYKNAGALRDFMYYKGNIKPKATSSNTLNIKLRHKIAYVTVVVNNITSSPIATIANATLGPHYTDAKFNLNNGHIVNTQNVTPGLALNFPSGAAVTRTATPVFINSGATNATTTSHAASFKGDITIGADTKTISLPGLFSIKPGYRQTFNVNLSKCGAYLGANSSNWKEFMCWNLGANQSLDPFVPAAGIHGAKYQWGYKPSNANVSNSRYYTQSDDQSNSGNISGWNQSGLPNGSWSDTSKTVNDPCPAGYRVPTAAQWQAVINNNQIGRVGTWTNSTTNYTSGLNIGGNGNSTLFLPAAGSR
ncbi:hypothetical protein CMU64_17665, partial [Elizabethkingia anophelis]|nr:hypothetical protein [Elizabethkingia anophelis]